LSDDQALDRNQDAQKVIFGYRYEIARVNIDAVTNIGAKMSKTRDLGCQNSVDIALLRICSTSRDQMAKRERDQKQ